MKKKVIKERIKQNGGITLLALVITIIVLLILAGVSIGMIAGDGGIIGKANDAKLETEKSDIEEQINTIVIRNSGDYTMDKDKLISDLEEELPKGKEIEDSGDLIYITYPEYGFEVDLKTGKISQSEIQKAEDKKPGELEGDGSKEEPYVINSIEDLIRFSYEVTNGNTFAEKYVELGLSLDFNLSKSYVDANREDFAQYGYNGKLKETLNTNGFIPIGNMETETKDGQNEFEGIFNGNNHKIYNLKIKQNINTTVYVNIGLFAVNKGTISNIGIELADVKLEVNSDKFSHTGSLVGSNAGEIYNSYSTGQINVISNNYSLNAGGLVGSNENIVEKCYNNANVSAEYLANNDVTEIRVGGVMGANEVNAMATDLYSNGELFINCNRQEAYTNYIGGFLGGISGKNLGKIENSYSIGKMGFEKQDVVLMRINGIIGLIVGNEASVNNCYYKKGIIQEIGENTIITQYGEELEENEMKDKTFVDKLNNNRAEEVWKIVSGKNQGYPILDFEI